MKLSSGLQQRLGIARALLKQPRVLLLDEPTRSLDPAAAEHLWALVRLLSATGITILMATHNFTEAASVSDRIAVLQKGQLRGIRQAKGITAEQLRTEYMELTGECDPTWREGIPA